MYSNHLHQKEGYHEDSQAVVRGWLKLEIQGSFFTSWKLQYAVLSFGRFLVYQNEDCQQLNLEIRLERACLNFNY